MADFQSQAMGLTGLTIDGSSTAPSRVEFSQFLNDGVIDVTSRWLTAKSQDVEIFLRESAETTSNASLDLNGAQIISIIREDGVTSNNWRPCRKISSAQQYLVTDTESLSFASKFYPVYMIGDNGKISVFPAPGADPNAFKVYYVNNSPEETDGTALDHASTGIKYFPSDKVYLVILYASMQSLQAKMSATTITDLSINAVPPDIPTISAISYTNATGTDIAAVTNATVTAISFPTSDIPTYTKTSLQTARVSFNDFFESGSLNPFDDSDPGSFSVSSVPPDTPTIATISYSAASNADASATGVTSTASLVSEQGTVDVQSHAPSYTPPKVAGATEELTTTITAGAAGTAGDKIDWTDWWDVLADYIEDEEDSELAATQMQKISTYIQAYSAAMQNQLNEFN